MGQQKVRRGILKQLPHPWLLFLGIVVAYFLFMIGRDLLQLKDLIDQKNNIAIQSEIKRKDIKKLEGQIKNLNSNSGVETEARQSLGLVKAGETAYKVVYK